MNLTWEIKHFNELSAEELYKIFHLRIAVFVIEQKALYQDADGKDQQSFHLMGYANNGELIAYSRIIPAGIAFKELSIGRVVTSQNGRRTGAGKELIKNALQFISKQFGPVPIRIGAQCYLIKFYSDFGFKTEGEEYIEDMLPHIEMRRIP
ncbi:MAG: GNAT family N-acetyltransferase [Bacteroidota bacterium]